MKGYKGMKSDMTCRGMQYEIGKTYHTDEGIGLCQKGYHFCETLKDVFGYYSRDNDTRFFEVEATDEIISDGTKSVTNEITIIRELSPEEVNRCFYGNGNGNGYGNGNGNGYGNGNGNGYGYGYGYGNGYGDGYGYGYGYGDGDGYGDGYGDGNGYGYGNGNGNGYGKNLHNAVIL